MLDFKLILTSTKFLFLHLPWSEHPAVKSMESDNTEAFQRVFLPQPTAIPRREEWEASQQMGWHNVAVTGDLHEYELQRAQITWFSKAVRNLECQSHLADI